MKLERLKEQLPYKWKPQNLIGDEFGCVAYIDSRTVMDHLDEVCGPENWQSAFKQEKNTLFGGIGIKVDAEWVWKWDAGTESNIEKVKGEASDALKRAGVQWGIGRFLYSMDIVRVKTTEHNGKRKPCDDSGKIIWSNDTLTDFINAKAELEKNNVDYKYHLTGWLDASCNGDEKQVKAKIMSLTNEMYNNLDSMKPAHLKRLFEKCETEILKFEGKNNVTTN